ALRFPQALTLEDSAQQSGHPGDTLTYRLWARNTTTLTQTLTLALSGTDWTAAPLNQSTQLLAPGAGQALSVTLQVPGNALPGQRDVFTATLSADSLGGTLGQAVLTGLTLSGYGVQVAPPSSQRTGLPGDTFTYTFTLTNTGNLIDTFALSLGGASWPVSAPSSIGPLPPFASQAFTLSVDIPLTATDGAQDAVLLTLTSQADPTVSAQATFTTTADLPGGVTLAADSVAQSALPGEVVTYTLTLTNSGLYTDTYDLSLGASAWSSVLSVASAGPLSPGASAAFTVRVSIPASAADGESDALALTALSQSDPAVLQTLTLTTTARWHHVYIPLTVR
ncbi:MAG: hypothetical protein D6794_00800, partial [Deltaproteobacteria bacterium]